MRLSTEILAVVGDAREEAGLGRRQLWFVADSDTYVYANASNDVNAYADTCTSDNAYADTIAYADATAGAYADATAVAGAYADANNADADPDSNTYVETP